MSASVAQESMEEESALGGAPLARAEGGCARGAAGPLMACWAVRCGRVRGTHE